MSDSTQKIAMMGLAVIADANPTWEMTPIFTRILGRPKFRYWRYATSEWVYAHTRPEPRSYGGIDAVSNPYWRNRVYDPKETTP